MTGSPRNEVSVLPDPPSLLYTNDGEWAYYIHGHDEAGLLQVDDPDVLEFERLWLQPVTTSSVDEFERPEDHEVVTRGPDGRFQSTYVWFECRESDPGAEPYLGVKYAPV